VYSSFGPEAAACPLPPHPATPPSAKHPKTSKTIVDRFRRFRRGRLTATSATTGPSTSPKIAPTNVVAADVTVLMVAVELCGPVPLTVSTDASSEQLAYCAGTTGVQVSATAPVNPFNGVSDKPNVAAVPLPLTTVAEAAAPPFTVSTNDPGCAPIPVSGTTIGPAGSELVIVSVAVLPPAAAGVNATVTMHPAPAASVVVEHGPVTSKSPPSVPLTAAAIPVTAVEPVLLSVSDRLPDEPTVMLPKASAPGVAVSVATTPLPVRGTVSGRAVALVATLSVPVAVPPALGVNVTVSMQLAPAARVDPTAGHVPSATVKLPLAETPRNVAAFVPVFATVSLREVLPPTLTVPKFNEEGLRVIVAGDAVPTTLMKSSEVPASETISIASESTLAVDPAAGANCALRVQEAPGSSVEQFVEAEKSAGAMTETT
jgi:hypothetical protein